MKLCATVAVICSPAPLYRRSLTPPFDPNLEEFQRAHRQWVEQALQNGSALREDRWSEAIAVGSWAFVEKIKGDLGIKALHREVESLGDSYALRERSEAYAPQFTVEIAPLRMENTIPWEENAESAET
jgi:hypothetical protein